MISITSLMCDELGRIQMVIRSPTTVYVIYHWCSTCTLGCSSWLDGMGEHALLELRRVFPQNPEEFVHYGASCGGCGMKPILGRRYRCLECTAGFNLCIRCFEHGRGLSTVEGGYPAFPATTHHVAHQPHAPGRYGWS